MESDRQYQKRDEDRSSILHAIGSRSQGRRPWMKCWDLNLADVSREQLSAPAVPLAENCQTDIHLAAVQGQAPKSLIGRDEKCEMGHPVLSS
jgi:hypothetical protein